MSILIFLNIHTHCPLSVDVNTEGTFANQSRATVSFSEQVAGVPIKSGTHDSHRPLCLAACKALSAGHAIQTGMLIENSTILRFLDFSPLQKFHSTCCNTLTA